MTPEIDLSNWKNAVAIYFVDQTGKTKSARGRLGVHFWTCFISKKNICKGDKCEITFY